MRKITKSTLERMIREEVEKIDLKSRSMTRSAQSAQKKRNARDIGSGKTLNKVTDQERAILHDVEAALTKIADEADLMKFRSSLQALLNKMQRSA